MLTQLERMTHEIAALHSKLILLVGPPGSGKTALLRIFADNAGTAVLNLGLELGRRLAAVPQKQRPLQAGALLRETADRFVHSDLLLVDNIELLFDSSLKLNPLDLLKRQAHARRVVAVWPGELRHGTQGPRLLYAEMGHPEYRDYGLDGLVPLEIKQ